MFDYRQYMSAPQQMISGPTRGDEARRMVMQQAETEAADKKIAAETSRREAREDAIRAEDRAYYESKEANDRIYYEQKEAKQRADDDARYESQMNSYQSGYANQTSAAVDPQRSGSFMPNPRTPGPDNSTFQVVSLKPLGDRNSWTTEETRNWKAHRGVTDKYS